jgi:uncharacterized membrane protein
MQITPSRVYRKTEAAWDMAVLFGMLFWMPIIAIAVLAYFIN